MKVLVVNGLSSGRVGGLGPASIAAACSAVAAEPTAGGGVLL